MGQISGIHRRHGKLDGVWRDCVIVELLIGDQDNGAVVVDALGTTQNLAGDRAIPLAVGSMPLSLPYEQR